MEPLILSIHIAFRHEYRAHPPSFYSVSTHTMLLLRTVFSTFLWCQIESKEDVYITRGSVLLKKLRALQLANNYLIFYIHFCLQVSYNYEHIDLLKMQPDLLFTQSLVIRKINFTFHEAVLINYMKVGSSTNSARISESLVLR
jgi:hypothetical protein